MNTSLNFEKLAVISDYNKAMIKLNLHGVTNMANFCKGKEFLVLKTSGNLSNGLFNSTNHLLNPAYKDR